MAKTLKELLEGYQKSPPRSSRARAMLLQQIWAARSERAKEALLKKHNRYWAFPELPDAGPPIAQLSMILCNVQEKGFDVGPCWQYWDQKPDGFSPNRLRTILRAARKASKERPGQAFDQALRSRLLDAGWEEQGPPRTTRRIPEPQLPAQAPRPETPTKQRLESVEIVLRVSLAELDPERRRLVAMSALARDISEEEYLSSLMDVTHLPALIDADAARTGLSQLLIRAFAPLAESRSPAPRLEGAPPRETRGTSPRKKRSQAKPTSPKPGDVPTYPERLKQVILALGNAPTHIDVMLKELEKRPNWLPDSTDLMAYTSSTLSSHKDTFERVSKGTYRVKAAKARQTAAATQQTGENEDEVSRRVTDIANGMTQAIAKALEAAPS